MANADDGPHDCEYREALHEVLALFGSPDREATSIVGNEVVKVAWLPDQDPRQLAAHVYRIVSRALSTS